LTILESPDAIGSKLQKPHRASEPTATSVGTAPPRGRSNVLLVPSAATWSSWLPFCSVAHIAPSAVTATP
jgi:hypothetical protein